MTLEQRIRKYIEDMRKVDCAVVPAVIANDLQEIVDAATSTPRYGPASSETEVGHVQQMPANAREGRADGVARIAAERRRHVDVEGWTPEHDARHDNFDLAAAASAYSYFASLTDVRRNSLRARQHPDDRVPNAWPWDTSWWKPGADNTSSARIRELEKAGSLNAAEIDRLLGIAAIESGDLAKVTSPDADLGPVASATTTMRGWKVSASYSDARTWLRLDTPEGSSAVFSCVSHTGNGAESITSQVAHYFADSFKAAFKGKGHG